MTWQAPYANPFVYTYPGTTKQTQIGPTAWPGHSEEDVQRLHNEQVEAFLSGIGEL